MRRVLLCIGAAGLLLGGLFAPPAAHAAAAPEFGRITGVVSTKAEAAAIRCPPASTVARESVGIACYPKKSNRWYIDQIGGCMLKADTTTAYRMAGTCVLAIDEGPRIKVWAPPYAVSEDYRLVWR